MSEIGDKVVFVIQRAYGIDIFIAAFDRGVGIFKACGRSQTGPVTILVPKVDAVECGAGERVPFDLCAFFGILNRSDMRIVIRVDVDKGEAVFIGVRFGSAQFASLDDEIFIFGRLFLAVITQRVFSDSGYGIRDGNGGDPLTVQREGIDRGNGISFDLGRNDKIAGKIGTAGDRSGTGFLIDGVCPITRVVIIVDHTGMGRFSFGRSRHDRRFIVTACGSDPRNR